MLLGPKQGEVELLPQTSDVCVAQARPCEVPLRAASPLGAALALPCRCFCPHSYPGLGHFRILLSSLHGWSCKQLIT